MKRIEVHKKQHSIFYESYFLFASQIGNQQLQSKIFTNSDRFIKKQLSSAPANYDESVIVSFSSCRGISHCQV